jgi:hypothetical protein
LDKGEGVFSLKSYSGETSHICFCFAHQGRVEHRSLIQPKNVKLGGGGGKSDNFQAYFITLLLFFFQFIRGP